MEDSRNFALELRRYLKPIDTVLDFGCGIGGYAFEVSKFCKVVVGIDINRFYIRIANKLYAKKTSKVKFYWYNGDNIPFDDDSFDMIYAHAVFERIPKISVERYLKEFWRILRPNGKILADFLREEASDSDFVGLLGPDAYIFWSEMELINTLTKSGFRVQNLIKTPEKFITFAISVKSLNMR
jgi:ubiquinone/menaquinone biosynthesis C-methylase UbiE